MSDDELYIFDDTIPRRIERFFAEFLVHSKGRFAGKPFVLLPWQKNDIRKVYGWYHKSDRKKRRYRQVLTLVPKKQGKTHLIAGLCLYELLLGDQGGEIIAVANSREQARILFSAASDIVACSPRIRGLLEVHKIGIFNPKTRSKFIVLSSDASKANGYNPSFVVFDELADAKDNEVYNRLMTGMGVRENALMWAISTAGFNKRCFCYELVKKSEDIEKGVLSDPEFCANIYAIKDGEDWKDEEVWKRCLPSLGETTPIEFIRAEFAKAQSLASYVPFFQTYYLNAWLSTDKGWITDERWMECADETLTIEDFKGESCHAGLDLGVKHDLSALVLCFFRDGKHYLFPYVFCPEDGIKLRAVKDKVYEFQQWAKDGVVIATPGEVQDHDYITKTLLDLNKDYRIEEIACDINRATVLMLQLRDGHGFNVTSFPQGYVGMTSPMKMMEQLVLTKGLVHSGHPALRWCLNNVIIKMAADGRCMCDKGKSGDRIDAVVASLMALEKSAAANVNSGPISVLWS